MTSVALVGLGNIGSQTAALLAGVDGLRRVLLVDPDGYEASNLGHQRIAPRDVGRRKVDVQARSLRRLAPHLTIDAHALTIESLPLGLLRGCVMLSCVDSRLARQSINGIAVVLGLPWIDAAVDRDGQVRSRVYAPGGDCLECAWSSADYALLEQRLPCDAADWRGAAAAPATAAPQELGAVAAGLQVSHLRRLLSAAREAAEAPGRQWFYDLSSGRGWVGMYCANPHCLVDHRPWQIVGLPSGACGLLLGEALRLLPGDGKDCELSLHGQAFVRRLRCRHCGAARRSARRIHSRMSVRACRHCGGPMVAAANDADEVLSAHTVPRRLTDMPLSAFGLVDGDVFTLRSGTATRHFQLATADGAC